MIAKIKSGIGVTPRFEDQRASTVKVAQAVKSPTV